MKSNFEFLKEYWPALACWGRFDRCSKRTHFNDIQFGDFWGLDNLIWVLGYSGNGGNMAAWYSGDAYVDLIGADSYNPGANVNLFEECNRLAPDGMLVVFHECGTIPTEEQMKEGSPWSFFMVWHTDFITDEKHNSKTSLNEIYNSEHFITLDELPFKK